MMSYSEEFKSKLKCPEQAALLVKNGDWVVYNSFNGKPVAFDKALVQRRDELEDIKIIATLSVPPLPSVALEGDSGFPFLFNNWHFGGFDRKMSDKDRCWYIPITYHEVPRLVEEYTQIDVFVAQVTPMNKHGYFNYGPQNSHSASCARKAKLVILEVNEQMPYSNGGYDEGIHISEVSAIILGENPPMFEVQNTEPGEVDSKIANLIVEELEDGSCIQLGIGAMPNAVGTLISKSDLKDLGVHTEMLVDAYVDMYLAGKITGANKTIDRYKMAYTFAIGSKKLYDFIDHNPGLSSYPVNYTNAPANIARNKKVVSINNCIEVDLFGQVCSESSGFRQISGTGGQLDFVKGAFDSPGGKSFLCLASTYKDKEGSLHSRLRATLPPGAIVTVPRMLVHYLVTEFGKVCLKGLTTWQRAEKIIGISHPQFRDELVLEAEKMGIWRPSNKR